MGGLALGAATAALLATAMAHATAALPGQHPDAGHLVIQLAGAVIAHSAAGSIAQGFGAIHRAGHAGLAEHALTTGLTIKQPGLDSVFNHQQRLFHAPQADGAPQQCQKPQHRLGPYIDNFQQTGMAHRPFPHAVGRAARCRRIRTCAVAHDTSSASPRHRMRRR